MIEVQTTPAPIETVTPIRPSEAIRLGCLTTAQAFNWFKDSDGAVCAMGAMAVGLGGDPNVWAGSPDRDWATIWDRIVKATLHLPCPAGCDSPKGGWVPHLNDDHRWSRERIADWLESLGL